jgi:RimJ/RimL family protein N-acetyltransferase
MTPTLQGSLVTLRPLSAADAPSLAAAAADGELWTLPFFTVVPSAGTVKAYVDKALQGQTEGTVMPFAVTLTADRHIIGSTRFWTRLERGLADVEAYPSLQRIACGGR